MHLTGVIKSKTRVTKGPQLTRPLYGLSVYKVLLSFYINLTYFLNKSRVNIRITSPSEKTLQKSKQSDVNRSLSKHIEGLWCLTGPLKYGYCQHFQEHKGKHLIMSPLVDALHMQNTE